MSFRAAIVAILIVAGVGSPALAQQFEIEPSALATEIDSAHQAAAENFYRATIFDNGAMEVMFGVVETQLIPDLRASIVRSPLYSDLRAERREALLAVIDGLPDYLRQQINAELTSLGARIAPRIASHMSTEHLNETAEFLRSEALREPWRRLAEAAMSDNEEKESGVFPNWRSVGDFAQTPAGIAFAQEEQALAEIFNDASEEAFPLMFARLRATAAGQVCDALADECPARIRDAAGRI